MFKSACGYILVFLMAFGMTACKKVSSDFYTSDFYIRAPLIEINPLYIIPGSDYYNLNIGAANSRKPWKFIPLENNEYNIAVTDSISLLITDEFNVAGIRPKSTALANNQKFRIVSTGDNPLRVAFQSPVTGNFLQLGYCYKGNETYSYLTVMEDSTTCQLQNIAGQADTCYCVYQFVLERN